MLLFNSPPRYYNMALNAYETERLANIERNKVLLEQLDIQSFGTMFPNNEKALKPAKQSSSHLRKRKRNDLPPPTRSSTRIRAAEKPTLIEEPVQSHHNRAKDRNRQSSKRRIKESENEAGSADPVLGPHALPDWTWNPTAPLPTRASSTGTLDFPDFSPNKTPAEVLREGAFGGGYFRPVKSRNLGITIAGDWREIPPSWLEGLSITRYLTHEPYDPEVNKFKRSCGQSIEAWEAAGWIDYRFDARGWFQWYLRFYQGRRCGDDERQVGRWKNCVGPKGRWRKALLKKYGEMGVREVFDDGEEDEGKQVSPVVHQTCHHWAFELRQQHLDEYWQQRDGDG